MKTWRDKFRPYIAKILADLGDTDIKTKRKALRDAYPLAARTHWPYKVWCDEVRFQLGLKKTKTHKLSEINTKTLFD
jgi:hypothetical protein